jgi:hypothetical protein
MNTAERIAGLEQQIVGMQSELKALKAGPDVPMTPPRPADPDRPRPLVTLIEERSNFVQPTPNELHRLYEIVLAKYPQLGPYKSAVHHLTSVSSGEHFDGFLAAFERLAHVGRTERPDTRYYVDHFADEAKNWLARHRPGFRGNVGAGFLSAVVAHSDIPFIVANPREGVIWSVGITTFGGKKATDAWRRVLTGVILSQSQPARRMAPPSPARVIIGGL